MLTGVVTPLTENPPVDIVLNCLSVQKTSMFYVILSSTEAEYLALNQCVSEFQCACWFQNILIELDVDVLLFDNSLSAL